MPSVSLSDFVLLAIISFVAPVQAAPSCVTFDVADVVACQDVTPAAVAADNPAEKLIQARFPISSLIRLGRENSLIQYLYVIASSSQPFHIVDYSPKTELTTDVDGTIKVENSRGRSNSIGIKAVTPHEWPVISDASASVGSTATDAARYQQFPPRQLLSASGTMHRGAAVYFKLRPSTQTSLEGDKMFEIVARVPRSWRGGLAHIHCAAYGEPRGVKLSRGEEDLVCGTREFLVGIYLDGDDEARESVWNFAQSQQQLRKLAVTQAGRIDDERFPTWGHKLGAAFSLVEPRIPRQWLQEVLATPQLPEFSRHLPQNVRVAAARYDEARRLVRDLAGS